MDNDFSLKRQKFAVNIRRDQRERKMRQIRERHIKLMEQQAHKQDFNEAQFQKLKELSRESQFNKDLTLKAFEYLFSKNNTSVFSNENNLKFISKFEQRVCQQKVVEQWQTETIKKIHESIIQLIQREIFFSPKDIHGYIKPTVQLDDLKIVKKCFNSILNLATGFTWHIEFMFQMSLIRNKDLKNQIFQSLKDYFDVHNQDLCQSQIQTIIYTMKNLFDDLKDYSNEMMSVLQTLLAEYQLNFNLLARIIDFFNGFLEEGPVFEKVKFLIEDTQIYQGLTEYLKKQKNPDCYQLVSKLALFVFKIYSPNNEQLCDKIYMKGPFIVDLIRSWLPIAPSTPTPRPFCLSTNQLTHSNFSCTQSLIFALTNISASGPMFMSIIVTKSDIYFSIISIYNLCPVSCRQEIAVFARNCISTCDSRIRKIIMDGGFMQLLIEMIRELGSQAIIKITMEIILWFIRCSLETDEEEEEEEKFGFSRERFIRGFESLGGFKEVEPWCDSDDSQMAALAGSILNLIKQ